MHEQKMHYLHEFHRQEIRARDKRVGVLEEERKRMGRRVDEEGRVWLLLEAAREDSTGDGEVAAVREEESAPPKENDTKAVEVGK